MPSPVTVHCNEVQVRAADASLVRKGAEELNADTSQNRFRAVLKKETGEGRASFKVLLAAAPLDGVDLTRSRDPGRKLKP
jgi:hypothetical protein